MKENDLFNGNQIQKSDKTIQWKNGKYLSLSRKVYELMLLFYATENENVVESEKYLNLLDFHLAEIEKKFQN